MLGSKQQGYVGEGAICRGQMQSDGRVDDVVDVQGVDVVDVVDPSLVLKLSWLGVDQSRNLLCKSFKALCHQTFRVTEGSKILLNTGLRSRKSPKLWLTTRRWQLGRRGGVSLLGRAPWVVGVSGWGDSGGHRCLRILTFVNVQCDRYLTASIFLCPCSH